MLLLRASWAADPPLNVSSVLLLQNKKCLKLCSSRRLLVARAGGGCDTKRMGFHLRHHSWGHTIVQLRRTTRARAPAAAPKAHAHVPQSRHRLAVAQQRKRERAIARASGTFTPGCRGRRSVRRGSAACCRTALCHQACWSPKCSRGSVRLGLQLKQA